MSKIINLKRIVDQKGIVEGYRAVKRFVEFNVFYNSNNPIWSLKCGRILPTIGIVSKILIGTDLYEHHLRQTHDRFIIIHVNNYRMWIDLDDPGLSKDLISYGIREPRSTKALLREIQRMDREGDTTITIMEMGANIGYYALLEATNLPDSAEIHAFEPEPQNFSLLQRNIELNDIEDKFTTHQVAVGDKSTSVELEVTEKSNLNAVHGDGKNLGELETGETLSVNQISVDQYLSENEMDPEDVDLVRMDVEGHEYEIFKGMQSVFECESDVIIFFETHFRRISDEKKEEIIDMLVANDFEIIHAARGFRRTSITDFEDLRQLGGEVILRRS